MVCLVLDEAPVIVIFQCFQSFSCRVPTFSVSCTSLLGEVLGEEGPDGPDGEGPDDAGGVLSVWQASPLNPSLQTHLPDAVEQLPRPPPQSGDPGQSAASHLAPVHPDAQEQPPPSLEHVPWLLHVVFASHDGEVTIAVIRPALAPQP